MLQHAMRAAWTIESGPVAELCLICGRDNVVQLAAAGWLADTATEDAELMVLSPIRVHRSIYAAPHRVLSAYWSRTGEASQIQRGLSACIDFQLLPVHET